MKEDEEEEEITEFTHVVTLWGRKRRGGRVQEEKDLGGILERRLSESKTQTLLSHVSLIYIYCIKMFCIPWYRCDESQPYTCDMLSIACDKIIRIPINNTISAQDAVVQYQL